MAEELDTNAKLDYLDYYQHPSVHLTIDYLGYPYNSVKLNIHPTSKLTKHIIDTIGVNFNFAQFMGTPLTKYTLYSVAAAIRCEIQKWRSTRKFAADRWPEINTQVMR